MKKAAAGFFLVFSFVCLFSTSSSGATSTSDPSAILRARSMLSEFTCPSYLGRWGNMARENLTRAKKNIELFDRGIQTSKEPIDLIVAGELRKFRGACEQSIEDSKKPSPDDADVMAKADLLMKKFHCPTSIGRHAEKMKFFKKEALSIIDDIKSHRNQWVSLGPVDARVGCTLANFNEECAESNKAAKRKVAKG